jgi:formate hydrogenlyase subunit 6/NADH:ubiquinone oxidoreductase subunit I
MVLPSEGADQARLRLDGAACIACGLCVTACPEGALQMRPDVELARPTRRAQITESVTRRSE